jgi:UMF1 family MFS transporter
MALLTPEEKRTEFFGFYDGFFGKASAVVGPLIFGEVSARLGQRPAMLVIAVFFILGIFLIMRVPDVRAAESAGSR